MTDDITRAFDTEARAICTKATNFLEEQPEEVMDDYEEEMDTSITPCNLLPLSSFFFFILSLVILMSKSIVLCLSLLYSW